jgi:uncharacterized protein (DUF2236 family)
MAAVFDSMRGRLEGSEIVFEFLRIMRSTTAFPPTLRWLQPMVVRAAIDLAPPWTRAVLGLQQADGLRPPERALMRLAGSIANRIVLPDSPPAQACLRMGLPKAYLYG